MILFVGFQAENTLGRKLLDGQSPVPILGEHFQVRAEVRRADGYSAHADQTELVSWAQRVHRASSLRTIFLVHGEEPSCHALAQVLAARINGPRIEIPYRGDQFELLP